MKKLINVFILSLFFFIAFFFVNTKEVKAVALDANGNWYWGYESLLDDSYYQDLEGVTNSNTFESKLHTIISTGFKHITYSGALEALRTLDEDPNNTSNVLCLYTGKSFSKTANGSSGTSTWNREHTWAKSHGFPESGYSSSNPYSDIHHLRVTECQINSTRGNSGFKEVNSTPDSYGNSWSGNFFEPRDSVKGDVARIMMYMDVRYNGDSSSSNVNLTLVNGETSGSSGNGEFGDLETLKRWHVEDPVDDLERRRNDRAYELQGNRNPFVDHPEYANIIYGTNYSDNTCTVNYVIDYYTQFDYEDDTIYEIGDKVKEPNVIPTNSYSIGFDGWYIDSEFSRKWNFSTDTLSGNLNLYPKFIYEDKSSTYIFQELVGKGALVFNYRCEISDGYESGSMDFLPTNGSGALSGLTTNQEIDLTEYFGVDSSLFRITANTNSKANFYIKANEIRLYTSGGNGSSISIEVLNPDYKITDFSISSADNSSLTTTFSDNLATVKNTMSGTSGNIKLYSLSITYESSNSTTYSVDEATMRFMYEFDINLWAELGDMGSDVSYGFLIKDKEFQAVEYDFNDNVMFSCAINHIPFSSFDEEITVYGYVKIDGEIYITNTPVTYSVKSLANKYLEEASDNEEVINAKDVLSYLAK